CGRHHPPPNGREGGACCTGVPNTTAQDVRPLCNWRLPVLLRGPGMEASPAVPEETAMVQHLLPPTVVGSYPQPDWLLDRQMLSKFVPRVRAKELWRVADPYLEQAQDDATVLAIRDMERAGIDIITDGEIRRESYS